MSGKGVLDPCGALCGAKGGLGGLAHWDSCTDCPDAGRPGLGGLLGGWARLTRSNPNEFGGCLMVPILILSQESVSLNFTSRDISKHWWAASQNWYPLDPSSYPMKIISWLFG